MLTRNYAIVVLSVKIGRVVDEFSDFSIDLFAMTPPRTQDRKVEVG